MWVVTAMIIVVVINLYPWSLTVINSCLCPGSCLSEPNQIPSALESLANISAIFIVWFPEQILVIERALTWMLRYPISDLPIFVWVFYWGRQAQAMVWIHIDRIQSWFSVSIAEISVRYNVYSCLIRSQFHSMTLSESPYSCTKFNVSLYLTKMTIFDLSLPMDGFMSMNTITSLVEHEPFCGANDENMINATKSSFITFCWY